MNYTVTDLNANTAYQFKVGTFNSFSGTSGAVFSSPVTTSSNAVAPAAVTNLAASANGTGQFTLNWSNVSGNSGYVLQYGNNYTAANDTEYNWTSVPLAANSTSAVLNLNTNSLYYFRIYAYSSGGESSCSNIITQTAYAAPTSVVASGIGSSRSASPGAGRARHHRLDGNWI